MEENISNSIELLGGSQTFLGVLATIIILFIIADKSNLIHYILLEVSDKIEKQIKSLQINTRIDSVLKSRSYKLLNYYLEKNEENSLKAEGVKLLALITSKRSEFQMSYISVENDDDKILDAIKNSKEPLLAPLYTFVFCIAIFIYDEFLRSENIWFNDTLISSLAYFILISYLYWFIMWGAFINKYLLKKNKGHKKYWIGRIVSIYGANFKKWHSKKINYLKQKSIILPLIIRISVCVLFLVTALYMNAYFFQINNYIIILFGLVIPILLIGIGRLYSFKQQGDYSYLFICGHYVAIIILSILLSISILYIIDFTNTVNPILILYTKLIWIKISIFIFVLLNGVFLPFILPYYCYNLYYKFSKKQVVKSEKKAENLVTQLQNDLDSFCDKIPQPNEESSFK